MGNKSIQQMLVQRKERSALKAEIIHADMTYSESDGYLGHVHFRVEGHKQPYELTLHSEGNLDDWNYSLNYLRESGLEHEIEAVERAIEEDDEFFDQLAEAAVKCLEK
jgi:hypothetical protein